MMAKIPGVLGDAAVLVNKAVNDQRQALCEVRPAEFDWMIGINLKRLFLAAKAASIRSGKSC